VTRELRSSKLTPALLRQHALPAIARTGDKEERGEVLIVGGDLLVPGAEILAGLAALRAGCGKLAIAIDSRVAALVAQAVPESLVVPLRYRRSGAIFASALRDKVQRADAILVGVGMPPNAATVTLAARVAQMSRAPLVLDAGALAYAGSRALPRSRRCVLTPHAGEMARLVRRSKAGVIAHAPAVAADLARALDATVVLKGARTFIANATTLLRNEHGHPGLGTSGSGDVLAGALAALLARGAEPVWAAAWAVRLHALAGLRLARRVGSAGFLAREIAHELPQCLRASGQG